MVIVKGLQCPTCGATEAHPTDSSTIQIRAYKVCIDETWYSQCLVCSGGYDKVGGTCEEARHNPDKGWFT